MNDVLTSWAQFAAALDGEAEIDPEVDLRKNL